MKIISAMQLDWKEIDREFFERELASFVPGRIFDAHCHLHVTGQLENPPTGVPDQAGISDYRALIDQLHPGRAVAALFLPMPTVREQMQAASEFIAAEIRDQPDYRGLFFVHPDDDPEWVRDEVRRLGLHGLKCYHTMAATTPTWEAEIPDYLPESLIKVADEEEWVITLHLVKSNGVADTGNIHWIRQYCQTYPGMRLILAHSARGFQPAHSLIGLPQLADLENLYFDTSANCEPLAHAAILRYFGPKRLMYGSDFFVSHLRGRHVAAGDSFLWLNESQPIWDEKHRSIQPVLVGLEHLRSLKWACWSERLTDGDVEDLFYNNAAQLLGVEK